MDLSRLAKYSTQELREFALDMNLKCGKTKQDLIHVISTALKEYEEYKAENIDKYKRISMIGQKGKEGVTYLVKTPDGTEYAMKTFRRQKSSHTLRKEAELQQKAAIIGVSPEVISVDTVNKTIVMEKMDSHLLHTIKETGELSKHDQKRIIRIFKNLDNEGIFHGDSNLLNYMIKDSKIYIIDFGSARDITTSLIRKLGTHTPNIDIMTMSLVMKLKEMKCKPSSYEYLLRFVPPGI